MMLYTVTEEERGTRLDAFLAAVTELSRTAAAREIEAGHVTVDGRFADKKYKLAEGETVAVTRTQPEPLQVEAEDIPLNVVYEDDDIIVINKPKGMVVHPAPGNYSGTLVNALLYRCRDSLSGIGGVLRPGIVHRIDKDTSGLLVVAKCDAAHRALTEELSHHGIVREYRALANGGFREEEGTVELPIGRHPTDRKRMAVLTAPSAHVKPAITHYKVLESLGGVSYLQLQLQTGRTHQIRVHMSALGHPLLGDTVYGGGRTPFERAHARLLHGQALHARALTLTHPRTGERMCFTCPMPADFCELLDILHQKAN